MDPKVKPSNTVKKNEKEMSKGEQNQDKQDILGMDVNLSKGAETEREKSSKRAGIGI